MGKPDVSVAGLLELSDWNLVSMMKSLMDKVESIDEHGQGKQREGNPKKEPTRDTSDQNSIIEIKNVFDGLTCRPDTAEVRICELRGVLIETYKTGGRY